MWNSLQNCQHILVAVGRKYEWEIFLLNISGNISRKYWWLLVDGSASTARGGERPRLHYSQSQVRLGQDWEREREGEMEKKLQHKLYLRLIAVLCKIFPFEYFPVFIYVHYIKFQLRSQRSWSSQLTALYVKR